jgi:hypothetical protein
MQTVGFKMGVLILLAVALVSLIPVVGSFVIAPFVALAVGAVAGRSASRMADAGAANQATKAGAFTGIGALLGSILGLTILLLIIADNPAMQEAIRNSEPHPEARIPYAWMAPLAALGGIVGGFVVGLFDLLLATVGGLLAGLLYDHNRKVPV